ncbi:hypothetical protein A3B02_02145 [Candidatus Roizmanbacteria bacterium RIFCSPLOWO2_01_FULL_42_14]|uniref:tRNA dimethylallyltransferase n=4 Tax=Candidatus Roizmaniibacteriota TaxID=1752723 RepID=A0A1F7K232_9BACT|nr:MAG: hypothetical protein A3D08_02525 [Candidatus Roizmanbacteria bacterium RIFCSPHIGHO2_02_FULL_43_11]OGK37784.1 MAG: hypothetical protein A3F32_01530 [Candidatus Roizmanbacteria bacterium RIFCSPHIGHO2_12_FULL_42_10]OGK51925.1 MAG: hypothetical protein A3B02_02145 [Candidatus Roizmanbacteria bacterium RIFCSPLOWO2_01_FULL_42_14]OGK61938.1 MAG: hypothetical protein A3I56_02315 [Candidatus Roizmanbacteria bacterium RIFCSPLOWO2_02_FULL_43_10]
MYSCEVIIGQTATGKTRRALSRAMQTGADVITIDSRQVYTHLNIVTGKDTGDAPFTDIAEISNSGHRLNIGHYLLNGVRVWGYDIVDPHVHFSSHDFRIYFQYIMENTINKDTVPIVVGGTYLYVKHLIYGLDSTTASNWKLRTSLKNASLGKLQQMLQTVDSQTFVSLNDSDRKNPHRLIRKIEIAQFQLKKHPGMVGMQSSLNTAPLIQPTSIIALAHASTKTLEQAITTRVDERLKNGAVQETRWLLEHGYTYIDPGLQALGYLPLISYIEGHQTLEEARTLWITSEVQYARRQLTFMKKEQTSIIKVGSSPYDDASF